MEAVARGCGYGATISPPPVKGSRSGSRSSGDISIILADGGPDLEVGKLRSRYILLQRARRPPACPLVPEGQMMKIKGLAVDGDSKKDLNPVVYLSLILLVNLASSSPTATVSDVVISPFPTAPTSLLSPPLLFPPAAKDVTLPRIASLISTDRALQSSLLLQLKSYFECCRYLVRTGHAIPVGIDEALARSLYWGGAGDGISEELLTGGVEETGDKRTCIAWFKVGSIGPSEEAHEKSPVGRRIPDKRNKKDDSIWGGVVFVDPASTSMAQAGSRSQKIPPTITISDYLRLFYD